MSENAYTVWDTNLGFEVFYDKEDAFERAWETDEWGDPGVLAVEGPGGEDLTEECREWITRQRREEQERWSQYRQNNPPPPPVGRIVVALPSFVSDGANSYSQSVHFTDRKALELEATRYVRIFGADRVKVFHS